MHVHVQCEDGEAKFWLDPVRLRTSGGFTRSDLNRIRGAIEEHETEFMEAWDEYFGR